MAKFLVLIVSGPHDPARVKAGWGFSIVSQQSQHIDAVTVRFFADGAETLAPGVVAPLASLIEKTQDLGIFTMARQLHAEQKHLDVAIRRERRGIDLHYVGEDLVKALTEGYQFVSF